MKYIRTDKFVFEPREYQKIKIEEGKVYGFDCIYFGRLIAEADTIKELCDEFIIVSDNYERPIISAMPFEELQLYAKGRTKYATCYGAIWTDKGLIYVAKMNDKGELELYD